jgi:DNA-directed RNA polymerase specialized sigma24 family protein
MSPQPESSDDRAGATASFTTTHWSVVLQAGGVHSPESMVALERLCRTYWYPLYVFARRMGRTHDDAKDATQGFFEHLLAKEKVIITRADPARGKFRTVLLTSFKHFLGQEWLRAGAQKRGGGVSFVSLNESSAEERYLHDAAHNLSPDLLYERRYAIRLLETVMERLQSEYEADGKGREFAAMKPYLTGDQGTSSYAELGAKLGLKEGTARVAAHRVRQRFHEIFRTEVAQTVTNEAEFDEEMRHLRGVLSA